jgi:hypothetical protein
MVALAAIWVASMVMSVFAPDMVTGSEHEHLPLAALTVWLWAAVASAYVLMGIRAGGPVRTFELTVAVLWGAVMVAVVAAPSMVTGSDPTTIPFATLVCPVVGALVTGFLALSHATGRGPHSQEQR